eukprot:TRINITY_DN8178_c0_g1_i1.p1 TRINITY_DN8178_c0_g1~~TRINITY_DN8178_c0_g1_i1.p1  ORF type:complete len:458 (-),score=71.00 TRINITY_DN8178_c0_g1_i1:23-1396(-)
MMAAETKAKKFVGPKYAKPTIKIEWVQEGDDATMDDLISSLANTSLTAKGPWNTYMAKVTDVRWLTAPSAIKRCLHLEVELGDLGTWAPGDAIGIMGRQPTTEVEIITKKLGLPLEKRFRVVGSKGVPENLQSRETGGIMSVEYAFQTKVDIRSPPTKKMIRIMAEFADDPQHKDHLMHLCSREGSDQYLALFKDGTTFYSFFDTYGSSKIPLEHLLESLTPLQPRFYSLASSPLHHPRIGAIAFNVVEFTVKHQDGSDIKKEGICSSWLERICRPLLDGTGKDVEIPLYLKNPGQFRIPQDSEIPLILIGSGTGVAPFRGFIQHRKAEMESGKKTGAMWLIFGCRHSDRDYIYRDEWESYVSQGVPLRVSALFSRENPGKGYVQHEIIERGEEFADLVLNKNASVFVCGDASGMMKGVSEAIIEVLKKYGKMSPEETKDYIAQMAKDNRYLMDVWL